MLRPVARSLISSSAEKNAPSDSTWTPSEHLAPEELAGAVDVPDLQAEEDPVRQPVGTGVDGPDDRVRPPDAEADDHVRAVGLGEASRQAPDVLDVELAVAVGERDQLVPGGAEAGTQRRAVPEVGRVVDGADDPRVPRGQLVGQHARPVAGAVIDGDDLERLGDRRETFERLLDEALDVRLLVVGREEVGEACNARRGASRVGHSAVLRLPMIRVRTLASVPSMTSRT